MEDPDILLVEDNRGDVRLVERAFERRDVPGTLHTVRTGEAALDWLNRRGEHASAPRPDLVLLDLNLPATSGHAVLEAVKADPDLRTIPVVVLTGSRAADDMARGYDAGANAYLVKPTDPDEFGELVERVVAFWLETAEAPPGADGDDGA